MKITEHLSPAKTYKEYRMPAEWEPHECCWMGWPHDQTYWQSTLIETQTCYSAIANAIAAFEEVRMLVHPEHIAEAKNILGDAITIIEMETDQPWLRDTGPNFLLNQAGSLLGSTWQFNAWGYEYRKFANDALIGDRILNKQGARNITSPIYAEGGSITVDGEGTIITTEQCLLNKNRNSHFSRQEVENELLRTLGCQKVIWLPGDADDEETDGHIDGICAFVGLAHVVMVQATDPSDPRRKIHNANIEALEGQTDAQGRPIKITIIPEASDAELLSEAYCTAYVNSYIANGAIIMPKYDLRSDQIAADIYASLYPNREIIQVKIDAIAIGGGGIHCITQQQPVSSDI